MSNRKWHDDHKVKKVVESPYYKMVFQLLVLLIIGLSAWFVRNVDAGLIQINKNTIAIEASRRETEHNASENVRNRGEIRAVDSRLNEHIMLDYNRPGPFIYRGNK